jgi:hypothetical protein
VDHHGLRDAQRPGIEVEVFSAQFEGFAAAESRSDDRHGDGTEGPAPVRAASG